MSVVKDPFPEDEVAGLAAVDVEPLRSHSGVREALVETPAVTKDSGEAESGQQARSLSESNAQRERDVTLPLNLTATGHSQEWVAWEDDDDDIELLEDDADEALPERPMREQRADATLIGVSALSPQHTSVSETESLSTLSAKLDAAAVPSAQQESLTSALDAAPSGAPVHARVPSSALDAMFDTSAGVPAGRAPLSMEWDEDEPATKMRLSASFDAPPAPPPRAAKPSAHLGARKPVGEVSAQLPAAASAPRLQSTSELPARFLDALKGHKASIVMAVSVVVGLVASLLIVRALAAGGVGSAVLEVSPMDAQVQVNGTAVSGTSSPYTVSDLKPGIHEIAVMKPGYNEYRGSFLVTAGASTRLPVIELAANMRDVGFSVRSVPTGAAVWVDGERTELVTPAKLTGINPGIHRLVLKHEGYLDYELRVFVPEATVLQLPAAELVALPAAPVEPVRSGRRLRSADEAEGYGAHRTRRGEASESERPSRAERNSYTSGFNTRRSRAADGGDDVSLRAAIGADCGKMGTLRLNALPWAQVTLDGQPIGNTPQQNLPLSPGKHKLLLSNPQLGLTKLVTIKINAGEIQTQVVNLAE
jgi:hypothetical protein